MERKHDCLVEGGTAPTFQMCYQGNKEMFVKLTIKCFGFFYIPWHNYCAPLHHRHTLIYLSELDPVSDPDPVPEPIPDLELEPEVEPEPMSEPNPVPAPDPDLLLKKNVFLLSKYW